MGRVSVNYCDKNDTTRYHTREAFDFIGNLPFCGSNANALSRPGNVLENMPGISTILASHRHGMGGNTSAKYL